MRRNFTKEARRHGFYFWPYQ